MSNETEEKKIEYPNIVERFSEVFQKLGIKKGDAYVDHCAKGDLENLEDVAQKLFEMGLHPSLRNQVVNFWAAEIKQPVPKTLKQQMEKDAGVKKRSTSEEEPERIYFVDPDTAIIRLASGNEKATTLIEAKELQKLIKKDLEEARKRQETEGEGKEPAFIVGESGAWTLNPKGKIGFGEFAVFQMYQDSLKKGEPIDPIDELARREEASVRLKEAMGVKTGGEDTEIGILDKLEKLGLLKKGEGGEGAMLSQLNALGLLKTPGEGEGSETMRALQTEVRELRESLHKQELDTVKGAVVSLSNQISEMRKDMESQGKLEGRYAILDKAMTSIDNQLSGIRGDFRPALDTFAHGGGRAEPKVRTPEEKAKLAKGLKDAVVMEKRARELEDELLFGKPPPS